MAGGLVGQVLAGGGFSIGNLAPGPLLVDLIRADGAAISLSIVLGDGEERELRLR